MGEQHVADSELFDDEGDYFSDEVVSSFCTDVTHFWRYSLQTAKKVLENDGKDRENFINPVKKKSGLRGTCLIILKNIRDKADDVTLINPAFARVTEYMDTQIELIGGYDHHGTYIKDLKTAKILLTLAENLKSEEFINSLLTISVDESLAAELVSSEPLEDVDSNMAENAFSLDDLMESDPSLLSGETGNQEIEEKASFSLDELMESESSLLNGDTDDKQDRETPSLSFDELMNLDQSEAEDKTTLSVKADVDFSEEGATYPASNSDNSEVENDVSHLLSSQEEAKAEALTQTFSIDDLFK
ncbi:hypothetical protein UA32_12110 [Photobacterium angustum]|uniref:hypothetical protein n=1 Tax=Photobacterium angustum TaxID=661 RepID=UPI0005E561E4|nr:hypothetical protein [Photobacterium angustum]KJG37700.1 hypothetical protein UA32_12110 [Photobacterium angustum]